MSNGARTEGLTWKNVLSEDELLRLLGVNKEALARLRVAGLPCLYVNSRCRLYLDKEVLQWAADRDKPTCPGHRKTARRRAVPACSAQGDDM